MNNSVLVDGRVFSTTAYDRGMGRYVRHILALLEQQGSNITVLLFRDCCLGPDDEIFTRYAIRFANYDPQRYVPDDGVMLRESHQFTTFLSGLIEVGGYSVYVDGTPFIGPLRLDLFGCPVIAICYDFIPLKHPDFYLAAGFVKQVYYNGLARLAKADAVISISQTVRGEAQRYLALDPERLFVIHPVLEDCYFKADAAADVESGEANELFSILGSHKSKNPKGAIRICAQLAAVEGLRFYLNAPKPDQQLHILHQFAIPESVRITASITDEEKFAAQSRARVIGHFSLEEGFGIPLLEALFLGRKVIALDIPINREFFDGRSCDHASAVFLLASDAEEVDIDGFRRFLDTPADPAFFAAVRQAYFDHWQASPDVMRRALDVAARQHEGWMAKVEAKIFSSIPGTSCGVADYSVAYVRSASGNVLFFFAEGHPENISLLPNIKVLTYLDYERICRSRYRHIPGLFNLAFSTALEPGIELMRRHAAPGDVALVHERRYSDGLLTMKLHTQRLDGFILELLGQEEPLESSRSATNLVFHPQFNNNDAAVAAHRSLPRNGSVSSAWLRALPLRFISHLSPEVMAQMQALAAEQPSQVVNDLEDLEHRFEFVPLGVDDRTHPAVYRTAQRLRTLRGMQQDDLVLGHFGLILNDVKRLWDVTQAVAAYADAHRGNRRVFFALVGRVIDAALFANIQALFANLGLADRLVYANPAQEVDFDAEIAACSAVFCLRVQTRGQLSHVYVRALSLGTPVIVNACSGYAYDLRTTLPDDDLEAAAIRTLDVVANPVMARDMRRRARLQFETVHRGDMSLRSILEGVRS
jgi:glycosyltransferase involved in cell wall biosynthesis